MMIETMADNNPDGPNDVDVDDQPLTNPNLNVVVCPPAVEQTLSTPDQIVPKVPDPNYPAVQGFTAKDPGLPK